jgi:uncharacterized protein (DUF433 family)
MISEFEVVSIPLETNAQGVIRIKGTRVSLDSILHAYYEDGATAEEIVLRFPTCAIEDIYTILSWALNNRDIVSDYLSSQLARRKQIESELREEYPSSGLRQRLLARKEKDGS